LPGLIWVGEDCGQVVGDRSGEGEADPAGVVVLAAGVGKRTRRIAGVDHELAGGEPAAGDRAAGAARRAGGIIGNHSPISGPRAGGFAGAARVSETFRPGWVNRVPGPAGGDLGSLCLTRRPQL